jgi:uncharacterized protein YndB with AHSA1/START domain
VSNDQLLSDDLAQEQSPYLIITRVFDAPRELVYKMWTIPEHLATWWGPHGYTAPVCTIDLRVGGTMLVCMHSDEREDHWVKATFEEIAAPERLVMRQQFCDPDGNAIDPTEIGFPPDFPREMRLTVTFADLGGRTKLTIEQTMPKTIMGGGARIGWNQSLDRLAAELAAR